MKYLIIILSLGLTAQAAPNDYEDHMHVLCTVTAESLDYAVYQLYETEATAPNSKMAAAQRDVVRELSQALRICPQSWHDNYGE